MVICFGRLMLASERPFLGVPTEYYHTAGLIQFVMSMSITLPQLPDKQIENGLPL